MAENSRELCSDHRECRIRTLRFGRGDVVRVIASFTAGNPTLIPGCCDPLIPALIRVRLAAGCRPDSGAKIRPLILLWRVAHPLRLVQRVGIPGCWRYS